MDFDFTSQIILQNRQVALRPLVTADAQQLLLPATADENLVQYSPYKIHTKEYLAEYIAASLAEKEAGMRYPFAIVDRQTGLYAGSTSLANVSNRDKRLEIGWTWIAKQFQQTGVNRACKFLLLSYAFETLGFERVEFKTDSRNQASRRAIEKIGGQYEGALRSHTLMNDGYRRTTVYYSILKNEWPLLKKTIFAPYAATDPSR